MDIQPGDVLEMKKEHPCGARRWEVLRVGMDFRLRCTGCGREVMLPPKKGGKALKKIISPADQAGEDRRNPLCVMKVRFIGPPGEWRSYLLQCTIGLLPQQVYLLRHV